MSERERDLLRQNATNPNPAVWVGEAVRDTRRGRLTTAQKWVTAAVGLAVVAAVVALRLTR